MLKEPVGSALGGNVFASASVHITLPLPLKDNDLVRAHAFIQAGSLMGYDSGTF